MGSIGELVGDDAAVAAAPSRPFLSRILEYGVGTTLYKLHVLLLIPLFAHFLPQSENGAVEVANFGGGLIAAVAMLSLVPVASNRHINARESDRPRVLGESALAMTALAGAVFVVAPVVAWFAAFGLGSLSDRYWLVAITFMAAALSAYVANMAYLLQLRSSRRAYSFMYASWAILVVSLTVIALVGFDAGATGYASANLVAGGVCSVMCLWTTRHDIAIALRESRWLANTIGHLRSYARASMPLLPVTLLSWVLLYADRRILEGARGLDEVGVYGLAVKISSAATVLLAPVTAAWWEHSMNGGDEEVAHSARRTLDVIAGITLVAVCAFVVARYIGLAVLLGDDYRDALNYTALLSLAAAMTSLFFVPFAYLTRQGRFLATAGCYLAACITNVGLNLVFARRFGIGAATWSNVAAYVVLVGTGCWLVREQLAKALDGRRRFYLGGMVLSIALAALAL